MPIYEVEYICALSDNQQDELAEAITRIHSEQFTTPRLFVNVRFTDASQHATYVAGKKRKSNRIIGQVRSGPSRGKDDYDQVCAELNKAWAKIVGTRGEDELRAIFIVGGLIAGAECGFNIPQAGEDAVWLQQHIGAFKKLADEGDQDFVDMIQDLRSREAFKKAVAVLDGQSNGA